MLSIEKPKFHMLDMREIIISLLGWGPSWVLKNYGNANDIDKAGTLILSIVTCLRAWKSNIS